MNLWQITEERFDPKKCTPKKASTVLAMAISLLAGPSKSTTSALALPHCSMASSMRFPSGNSSSLRFFSAGAS